MSARILRGLVALTLLSGSAACREPRAADADQPAADTQATAVRTASRPESAAPADAGTYDLAGAPSSQVRLPSVLREISGLAATADGRVFAHGDEEATIYEIDARSGQVTKRFSLAPTGNDPDLGKKGQGARLAGDFEDIAAAGDRLFLVTSNGVLLEFAEGKDGVTVPYQAYPTKLADICEVEGLAHDASTASLLLLCKTMKEKSERQQVAIYAWSLADRKLQDTPRITVPWSELARVTGGKGFNGSALAFTPGGRSLLLVAGPQQLFAEISTDGTPVRGGELDEGTQPQPESLAFLRDGTLLVASEGGKGEATLARYSPARRTDSR